MSGKVTPIEGVTPEPRMRQVVSYELSPLFGRGQQERYNPDELANTRGLRIYKQMMIDEQVKAVMVFKRDAITSRGWTFAFPESSALSPEEQNQRLTVLSKCIERMRGSFEDALNGIAKGRAYGFSLTEIVHDNITVDGKQYVGIHSLRPRDAAMFVFHTDEYGLLTRCVQKVNSDEIKINLNKFVHYVHAPEEDAYYGQSDLRQAYRSWYVKDQIIKLYGTFLERFAGGFAALELQEGNNVVPGTPSHETLKDVLRNMRNMAGMILPPNVKLNMIQPGNTAEYREALTYFDLAIAKSLLVPNLLGLSHTGQTGAYSQSQTQLEAFFWTINADTRRLEACLNEQLFRPLCAMNWGDDEYPHFSFKPASQDHVRWLVTTWRDLVGAQAVESTSEDEAYLRKLLEMPAREVKPEDEQDDALASNSEAAFDSGQITAMLDVLAKVADKTIPKETAIQLLVQSFPITEEDAAAMVNPIVPKDPPEPTVVAKPNGKGNGAALMSDEHAQPVIVQHFHTPGGVDHDQSSHGSWAQGSAAAGGGDIETSDDWHITPAGYTVPDDNHKIMRDNGTWGGSHSGSAAITGAGAKLMGLDGYRAGSPAPYATTTAERFLAGIYNDQDGSPEPLYHGFENVAGAQWEAGDEIRLSLTATSGGKDAITYGLRIDKNDQSGEPTMFEFPKGTKMAAYSKWSQRDAKSFGHLMSEALVAGHFRVTGVRPVKLTHWNQHDRETGTTSNPMGKIVTLEPVRYFNPETGAWDSP